MRLVGNALSLLARTTVPVLLLLVGAVVAMVVTRGGGTPAERERQPDSTDSVRFRTRGDEPQFTVRIPAGEASSALVLTDRAGERLAKLILFSNGAMSLESVQAEPVAFSFHRRPSGAIALGVRNRARHELRLKANVDGSGEFGMFSNYSDHPPRIVRLEPDWEL